MTVFVQNTALTNTVDFWRNRTNELADAMSTKTITVNSNTTTGNAVINGAFQANALHVINELRGGNNSTSATLTITSNVNVTDNVNVTGSLISNTTTISSVLKIGNSSVNVSVNSTTFTGISLFANSSVSNLFNVGTTGYFVANGNFGLGNSAPTTKLSVNGNSYFTGTITVTGNIVSNSILKVYDITNSQLFP